jgi:hypothetical protein
LNHSTWRGFGGHTFPKPTAPLSFRTDDRVVGLRNVRAAMIPNAALCIRTEDPLMLLLIDSRFSHHALRVPFVSCAFNTVTPEPIGSRRFTPTL